MVYQLNNVSVNFANRVALHHVNCTIQKGKWVSVIGQTGAGKSTFSKVLKGLIPSFDGDYWIDHQPIHRDTKGRVKVVPDVGYVFQFPEHQLFETTVYKELSFAPKLHGYSQQKIKESIDHIFMQMGLSEDILPLAPFQLSGGQKRNVAIASVLMMNPKLLILDEPTAGLDPVSRVGLMRLLKKWQQQDNRTILNISHQMNEVAEYSDEVIVFHEGHIIEHCDTSHLFLEQGQLLTSLGLSLPEPVQLLKLVEELSGQTIQVPSCRERDIFEKVRTIWHARGN